VNPLLEMAELDGLDQFMGLRKDWNNTLKKSDEDNIFSTWEWLSIWWKHFGKQRRLFVQLVKKRNNVLAIAPLMLTTYRIFRFNLSKIEFIGTGFSDYCNFLLTEEKETSLKLFLNRIRNHTIEWDCLDLKQIPETATYLSLLRKLEHGRSIFSERPASTCYYMCLPDSWKMFKANIRRKTRREQERTLRRLTEDYRVDFKTYNDVDSAKEAVKMFFELHQRRWLSKRSKGMVSSSAVQSFFLDVCKCFAENGWLNLSFLMANDEPISALLGFEYNGKYYAYLSGFDPAYYEYSPGNLLVMHVAEDCVRRKFKEFDFLRGSESYKRLWTSSNRKNIELKYMKRRIAPILEDCIDGSIHDWVTQLIGRNPTIYNIALTACDSEVIWKLRNVFMKRVDI
jgi:CelD/BcsL family acetyltransferase involved in cellulose biosynthesis